MFVHWKRCKLHPYNDRSDAECLHDGPDRWSWTPIVAKSVWTSAGSRRRTVFRPSPAIRSCCVQDPFIRVRWWNATADVLERASKEGLGVDIEFVMSKLAERVPLPTDEDLLVHDSWPGKALWWKTFGFCAIEERENVVRTARRLAVERLRPGDGDWQDALESWRLADAAFARGSWGEYVHWETAGLDFVGQAIAKARKRTPPAIASELEWLRVFQEHVGQLDERRARRAEEEARRRADEDRRREREAEEERRRTADEARQRARSRSRAASSGPTSVVDRMSNGSRKDWADLLGVTYPCTREELKHAHRESVLRHHPDRGGELDMMKAVNIAKEFLEKALEPLWTATAAQ